MQKMKQENVQDALYENYRRKRKMLLGLLILLLTVVLTGSVFGINYLRVEESYSSNLMKADKYYAGKQYEAAILTYQLSVQEKPQEDEPYLRMSEIYILLGNMSQAEAVLREGYSNTHSQEIYERMQRIYLTESTDITYTEDEMESMAEYITVNNTIFDQVAAYTYTDYVSRFGNAQISSDTAGLKVVFEDFPGECRYFNTASNNYIVDMARNTPYANRKPNYVELTSISAILNNYTGAVSPKRLKELFGNTYTVGISDITEQYCIKLEYRNCIVEMQCDAHGNVVGLMPKVVLTPLYEGEVSDVVNEEIGSFQGYINNAVTGGGVQAVIDVHETNRYGNIVKSVESSFDGSYLLELEEGRYVLEISAVGFITEYFDLTVVKGNNKKGYHFVLSPVLKNGEVRIVLEWGNTPSDLDSHLTGRCSSGSNINVHYGAKQARVSGDLVAELDIDDTSAFGPETTTIYDVNGSYEFRVHDFTNQSDSDCNALANSGATVKVYMPGENQPVIFHVPLENGVWWTVFQIEQGELIEINEVG